MSDQQPPAGALRLARVAGVPIYLDRTWLLLAAFVAWTGWRNASDLGTGGALAAAAFMVVGILVAVLGHEVAHAVAARLLGFRVHRVVATLWGGHTAYDATGSTPGRTAVIAGAGPVANLALAAVGSAMAAVLPWPASRFAWLFMFLNLLLAGFNLLPGLPLDGGQLVQALVWWVSGRRDTSLVVAGWCGRLLAVGLVVWYVAKPLLEGSTDLFGIGLGAVMGWILWSGATVAVRRAPFERLVARLRPDDVIEPVVVVPAATPVGRLVGLDRRVVSVDERGMPTLLLPLPSDDGPDVAALDPSTPLAAVLVRLPDDGVVDLPAGSSAEPLLRAMASSSWGAVVVTSGGQVRGLVTVQRLNAVAERVLGRN